MKIVQVLPYALDRPGGVQTHVRDLCAWLEAEGHSTRIIAPPSPGVSEAAGSVGWSRYITVHGTKFELSALRLGEGAALRRDLKTWRADVVHLHTPWTPALPFQVWRRLKLPTVATFHATLPEPPDDLLSRALWRSAKWMAPRLDGSVVPSEVPRAQWTAQGITPLPGVLPPAIDLSAWRAAGADRETARGPLKRVICVGRIEGRKGVDTLLQAWQSVAAALPETELTLAGRGTPETPLPPRVKLLQNASDAEVQRAVAASDLFVAPAGFGESYGLVLAEAMAAGAPVLAADNPAYTGVLNGAGALFSASNAEALAFAIVELSGAPDRRQAMTEAGLKEAWTSDVSNAGPRYLSLYETALSKRQGLG